MRFVIAMILAVSSVHSNRTASAQVNESDSKDIPREAKSAEQKKLDAEKRARATRLITNHNLSSVMKARGPVVLLERQDVQRELELNYSQIRSFYHLEKQRLDFLRNISNTPDEARQRGLAEHEFYKSILSSLNSNQRKRFNQLIYQVRGHRSLLLDPDFMGEMALDGVQEEQFAQIATRLDEVQAKNFNDYMQAQKEDEDTHDGTAEGFKNASRYVELVESADQSASTAIEKVLGPAQRKSFLGLFGKSLDFSGRETANTTTVVVQPKGPRKEGRSASFLYIQGNHVEGPGTTPSFSLIESSDRLPQTAVTSLDAVVIGLTQSPVFFSNDGKIKFYLLRSVDGTPAESMKSSIFDRSDQEGLGNQLNSKVELGIAAYRAGKSGMHDTFSFDLTDPAKDMIREAVSGNRKLRVLIVPADPKVVASYFGGGAHITKDRPSIALKSNVN